MAKRRTPHLLMRGGTFWVRITVPRDLQRRLSRREWKFSLRTREPRRARLNCLEATLAIARVTKIAREMAGLTDQQIASAARAYLAWALKHATRAAQDDGKWLAQVTTEDGGTARSLDHLADGDPANERAAMQARLDRLRKDLVTGQHDWAELALATEFARDAGFNLTDLDAATEAALLHAMQRARIEEARIRLAQLEGNYAETAVRDPLFNGLTLPLTVKWGAPPNATVNVVPTLGAAVERYKSSKEKNGAWVGKTVKDNERVLKWFTELNNPNTPITGITPANIREYVDALDLIPANLPKVAEFKGRALPEVIAVVKSRKGDVLLSQHTKAKYFANLKAFFGWCEQQDYCKSPIGRMTVKQPRDAKEQRYPFSPQQLKTLFTSPLYTGGSKSKFDRERYRSVVRDGKFWIPLIGLFAGMRLGEIVQLMTADVREIDGIWCFDISRAEEDEHGPRKRIKTASSIRRVPVHPMLREIGFLAHVEAARAEGRPRLFPDIKAGNDGYYSHNFSKYFSRYLARIGIKTKKTSFHSLRHNFADGCDHAGVPLLLRQALLGHAEDGVSARYGSARHPVTVLLENLAKIKFEVDLSHLLPARSVRSTRASRTNRPEELPKE